ncbi:hypothetical protein XSR1_130014 [Xenorhabdus szentirmaii DSM 16338]|uniref:Uncharacterized protein n=1 Tax=Xenorhabdus szentirmaii DSM 16338 TaxID=1427518 RepID=W1ISH1_9GAMM|nr:hypothetical protein XSR1_130014 [Xenorhabdus szentirmaii DSM 16338]
MTFINIIEASTNLNGYRVVNIPLSKEWLVPGHPFSLPVIF